MPGRFDTISIEEIIASAKMQLRLVNTSEYDDFLSLLINEAARHLNTLSIFKKRQERIDVVDARAPLPKGFHKLIGLRLDADDTTQTQETNDPTLNRDLARCTRIIYVDRDFLNNCGCDVTNAGRGVVRDLAEGFQIQHNHIIFNAGKDLGVKSAEIAFMGFNVDENGFLVVYEDYERALRAYACWKFTLGEPERYTINTQKEYKREWVNQKGWLKGEDVAHDFQKSKREVQEAWTALATSRLVNF